MRKQIPTLFLCLLLSLPGFSQSSDYVVQIAAFETPVSLDYFRGLSGIYYVKDHNDIHKYYIGGFDEADVAETTARQAQDLGYNARVIDMERIRNACALGCGMAPKVDPSKIRSIFFDFDRSNLRGASKNELSRLYSVLTENEKYTVELSAHTDSKGSLDYNKALSMRRANAAKNYLLSRGISADRIVVSTFGEDAPIAKNELNGQDTPEGRQYNRRVELRVLSSGGAITAVVEDIDVPASLRQ